MMGARGVQNEGMFIGNLLLLAGLGLIITAQWEMVRGNTFAYTILSAFGKCARCPRGSFGGDSPDKGQDSTMGVMVLCFYLLLGSSSLTVAVRLNTTMHLAFTLQVRVS